MSARIGFTLKALRSLDPGVCSSDARLVWRDGDGMNIGIVQPSIPESEWAAHFIQGLRLCGPRELRLLGKQMIRHADDMENGESAHEVVIP